MPDRAATKKIFFKSFTAKQLRWSIFSEATNRHKTIADHIGHRYTTIIVVSPCVRMGLR